MRQLDQELISGYFEEARGYLPAVANCLDSLEANHADGEVLTELYRLTHNLRTVTAAVGLTGAVHVAQGAEDLAEAIVSGAMPFDAEALELFRDALTQMTNAICDEPVPASSGGAAASAPQASTLDLPAEFVEGFLIEAQELLDRAWTNLQVLAAEPESRECVLEARRSVHTLKGSAAMVGLRDISTLAHAMEDALDEVHAQRRVCTAELHDHFARTLDLLSEYVANHGKLAGPESRAADLMRYYRAFGESPADSAPVTVPPPALEDEPDENRVPLALSLDSSSSVRLPLDRLDAALRGIGELSVARAAWDTQIASHKHQLDELALAIRRCQRIAHRLEADYAVFTPHGSGSGWNQGSPGIHDEFDALEFDRYTDFHLLARDLAETASDLVAIETQLSSLSADFEGTRARYSKATADLQDQVLRMRMAPAGSIGARLERTVRTAARSVGKFAEFRFEGTATELDKAALEQLAGPIEHLLRNAIAHGIEDRVTRVATGKKDTGLITVRASREGAHALLQVIDDGRGIDSARVRAIAVRNGLATQQKVASMDDAALFELLFEPGFSTAGAVTELAGRGIGLDVVRSAVESLKGSVSVQSTPGKGAIFNLRVPLSQAIVRVILVEASNEIFALPLSSVLRARKNDSGSSGFRQVDLEESLHLRRTGGQRSSLVLENGTERVELLVGRIVEIREVLIDPPTGLLRKAPSISGTTTLADGTVVLVLQAQRLLRASRQTDADSPDAYVRPDLPPGPLEVLVVDDSVSVRRVVGNTLRKHGWNVTAAKDGLEALEILQGLTTPPDIILLDVEMPRMDGYDFAVALRSESKYGNLPVVMLTSRGGDKHRQKAFDVGANAFLVKPYSEDTLIQTIRSCVSVRV